jgi:hypothetical protein
MGTLMPINNLHERFALFHVSTGALLFLLQIQSVLGLVFLHEAVFRVREKHAWKRLRLPQRSRLHQGKDRRMHFVNAAWDFAITFSRHPVNHFIKIVVIFHDSVLLLRRAFDLLQK